MDTKTIAIGAGIGAGLAWLSGLVHPGVGAVLGAGAAYALPELAPELERLRGNARPPAMPGEPYTGPGGGPRVVRQRAPNMPGEVTGMLDRALAEAGIDLDTEDVILYARGGP